MLDDDTTRVMGVEDRPIGTDRVKKQRAWLVVCILFALTSLGYRGLVSGELEQTAAMFIGLPTLLAIGLGYTARPESATGTIVKGSFMFLLLLGILLVEGVICILMASPLVLLVGVIIGGCIDRKRRKRLEGPWWKDKMNCCAVGVLAMMSLEGVNEGLSFDRSEEVRVSGLWSGSVAEAKMGLADPSFDLAELPGFLKLGFPTPRSVEGSSLEVGSIWKIHMAGGEGSPGDIVVAVNESSEDRVSFRLIRDESHVAHWLHWREIIWDFKPAEQDGMTQVTMTVAYERLLDPAWYFKPAEQYGVRKAAEYFMTQLYGTELNLLE